MCVILWAAVGIKKAGLILHASVMDGIQRGNNHDILMPSKVVAQFILGITWAMLSQESFKNVRCCEKPCYTSGKCQVSLLYQVQNGSSQLVGHVRISCCQECQAAAGLQGSGIHQAPPSAPSARPSGSLSQGLCRRVPSRQPRSELVN